jgi:hypothetical protein
VAILPERVERFVFIVLTTPESDTRLVLVTSRAPERLAISIVLFVIFVALPCTCPERVLTSFVFWATTPESDARLVLVAKIAPERVLKLLVTRVDRFERSPERVFTLFEIPVTVVVRFARDPERFVILVVLRSTCPERVPTVAARVARDPETVVIVVLRVFTVPESVVTVFVRFERLVLVVAKDPERFAILVLFWETTPESEVRFAFVVASAHENVSTIAERSERFVETVVICEFSVDIVPERAFCARVSVK